MPPPLEDLEDGGLWPWDFPRERRDSSTPESDVWSDGESNDSATAPIEGHDEPPSAPLGRELGSDSEPGEAGLVPKDVGNTWMPITPPVNSAKQQSVSSGSWSRLASPYPAHGERSLFDTAGVKVGIDLDPSTKLEFPHSILVQLPSSTLVNPRSMYDDFNAKAPEVAEWKAMKHLLELSNPTPDDDFVEFELDEFVVYVHSTGDHAKVYNEQRYPHEMRPLQHLSTKDWGCTLLYVDGYLSFGDTRCFVRKVAFDSLPIGNYGTTEHTVGDQIWIQSRFNIKAGNNVFFKLKRPASEYSRYHVGFLWIADLGKHVVDYMTEMYEAKKPVQFWHFKSVFHRWLIRRHGTKDHTKRWLQQYNREDFRIAVHANKDFIYKEAYGVLGLQASHYHTFWKEIREFTAYRPSGATRGEKGTTSSTGSELDYKPSCPDGSRIPPTIVTPYTYDCFGHLPFASMMQKTEPSNKTQELRQALIAQQHLEHPRKLHDSHKEVSADAQADINLGKIIKVGDVISTHHDEDGGHWHKHEVPGFDDSDRWFGLVQRVHTRPKTDTRSFDVTWIYRPADTICGAMKYPWNNELFLSDHCSCSDGLNKIKESEILGIHDVHWGGSSTTDAEFFCRQTYLSEDRRWITFQDEHRICSHRKVEKPCIYRTGDTVLALKDRHSDTLEPCVLLSIHGKSNTADVCFFRRREQLEPAQKFRPNELVYCPGNVALIAIPRISGRCLVRHFGNDEEILTPYDRDGVGNAFFVRTRAITMIGSVQCLPFDHANPFPPMIRQGFDPKRTFKKLKGFDLFCGGGNFGRGLEEAGVIEMNWANDINRRAIHTYMANLDGDQKSKVHPFVGSIDDLQRQALQGEFSTNVPKVGHVDFVSGGSPCPGFSRLTVDKTTPEQRKNQSLVASFASFIDLYRPKFGLLENVVEIVQAKKARSEDVFCQLICAIVGLGYQAHFFLLDAWTYGSPQSRSRVFLAFAAPGYDLPRMPLQSHAPLPADHRSKSLGWLPNGEPMVVRQFPPTPFGPVTSRDAVADLPDIGDGKPDCCIPFPDHRQCYGVTRSCRHQFSLIPIRPYAMNFAKSYYKTGIITASEREAFPARGRRIEPSSRGWGRVDPRKIMSTVTTTPAPTDSFVGGVMHWCQPRILTIMEVRRAQGFRDHEVILGDPRSQWATIGNSVAREVSLALGLSFREAWLGSLVDDDGNQQAKSKVSVDKPARQTYNPTRASARQTLVVDLTQDDADDLASRGLQKPHHSASPGALQQQDMSLLDYWAGGMATDGQYTAGVRHRSPSLGTGHDFQQLSESTTQAPSLLTDPTAGPPYGNKRTFSDFATNTNMTTTTVVSLQMVSTTTTREMDHPNKHRRTEEPTT